MNPKYYLYYEKSTELETYEQDMLEFSSKEELNNYIKDLEDVTYMKVISGFTLEERSKDNDE